MSGIFLIFRRGLLPPDRLQIIQIDFGTKRFPGPRDNHSRVCVFSISSSAACSSAIM